MSHSFWRELCASVTKLGLHKLGLINSHCSSQAVSNHIIIS